MRRPPPLKPALAASQKPLTIPSRPPPEQAVASSQAQAAKSCESQEICIEEYSEGSGHVTSGICKQSGEELQRLDWRPPPAVSYVALGQEEQTLTRRTTWEPENSR
jgi:hypothetical protein